MQSRLSRATPFLLGSGVMALALTTMGMAQVGSARPDLVARGAMGQGNIVAGPALVQSNEISGTAHLFQTGGLGDGNYTRTYVLTVENFGPEVQITVPGGTLNMTLGTGESGCLCVDVGVAAFQFTYFLTDGTDADFRWTLTRGDDGSPHP